MMAYESVKGVKNVFDSSLLGWVVKAMIDNEMFEGIFI